jgi:hypothetical protein
LRHCGGKHLTCDKIKNGISDHIGHCALRTPSRTHVPSPIG